MPWLVILLLVAVGACTPTETHELAAYNPSADSLRYTGELHLRNVRQLTFGGNNAEAYWGFDDTQLIFQSDWSGINPQGCDQNFVIDLQGSAEPALVSTGRGRTTCGYFLPDGRVLYASTHAADRECPEPPTGSDRYVWPIYDTFDIYVASPDKKDAPELLIGGPGYDAEATVSPDGRFIVFTSTRSGDLDLWRYEIATGEYLQLTETIGYDGGAFFSSDSQKIVWRASRPLGEEAASYQSMLQKGYVEPSDLNLFVADVDGQNARQITDLLGANWAPFFHPDGEHIIFSANFDSRGSGRPIFSLYMISLDGGDPVKITHSNTFDAFPMFSFDGTKLVFASNRNLGREPSRDTNIFIADWVEVPEAVDSAFVSVL